MYKKLREQSQVPLLIVISGPSGVGKDSVIQRMKERKLPFHFVVTTTSRARRPDEVEGVDYFFVSKDCFERMIERDELFEHALVYDDYKGIPKARVKEALESGKDVVMRLDVQGAETVHSLSPDALLIFITTTDEEELVNRLKSRRTETPGGLQLRIESARQEYDRIPIFDYYVINAEGQLDGAVDTIEAIIRAEHHRTNSREVSL